MLIQKNIIFVWFHFLVCMNYFRFLFVQIILEVWLIVSLSGVKNLITAPLFGFLHLSDLCLFIFFTLIIFNASAFCLEKFIFAAIVTYDDVLFAFLSMSNWLISLLIGPQSSFKYLFNIVSILFCSKLFSRSTIASGSR